MFHGSAVWPIAAGRWPWSPVSNLFLQLPHLMKPELDDAIRTAIELDALMLPTPPLPDCYPVGLSRRRALCWSCARLQLVGFARVAGEPDPRYTCRHSPLAPNLTRCATWMRESGADDDLVVRGQAWPIVGTAH